MPKDPLPVAMRRRDLSDGKLSRGRTRMMQIRQTHGPFRWPALMMALRSMVFITEYDINLFDADISGDAVVAGLLRLP